MSKPMVAVRLLALLLVPLFWSSRAVGEPLGGGSKVVQIREKVLGALGIGADVKADLVDIVVKHIDATGDWSLKYMDGDDIYGADKAAKPIRFFTVTLVKDGRTVVDTFSYSPQTGQMILSEVENIVLPITAGIDNSKEMAADAKYEKISEAASSAIYHKKGYLEDVAFAVNNRTNAVIKTFSSVFFDTLRVGATASAGTPPSSTFGKRPTKP